MKIPIKISLLLLASAAMVVSCKKSSTHEDIYGVIFEAAINSRATDTSFESGDQISVTAYNSDKTIHASNVKYRYSSDNIFSSLSPIIFASDQQSLSYRALYPYIELPESGVIEFEVCDDQSIDNNYTLSDLMSSYILETDSSSPTLKFSHLLSKVILNITSEDTEMVNIVTTLNLATKVEYNILTLSSATSTIKNIIKMDEFGTCGFRAIVVPQMVEAGTKFGTVTVDGIPYDITFDTNKMLYAGREYEFELYIRNGGISFKLGSITDWEDGNAIKLSEISATSYPTDSYSWSIIDEEASTEDFAGLRAALEEIGTEDELISLSFPNLKELPDEALKHARSLSEISLPKATTIGTAAFWGCASLTSITMESATELSDNTFGGCIALESVSLPSLSTLNDTIFLMCNELCSLEIASKEGVELKSLFSTTNIKNISLIIGEHNKELINGLYITINNSEYGPFKEIITK